MIQQAEGFAQAAEKLANMQSLEDILHTASSFEQTARDFYQSMIPRVSKRIRWLVEELAEEEQRHYDLLQSLINREDLKQQVKSKIQTPESDGRFTDGLHMPVMPEKPDDQEIMLYALGREQAAMEQYRALAKNTESGDIYELFAFLANEETQHKAELEKLYYEIVHSGGV